MACLQKIVIGCVLAATVRLALGEQLLMNWDGPFDGAFEGPIQPAEEANTFLRQIVQQTLAMPREQGKDVWAWRTEVEDRLVSLGPRALGTLQLEADQREGYELDALQVAMVRLRNPGLDPADAIGLWAAREFGKSSTIRVSRVLWSAGPPLMRLLFPHHLFYVVENRAPGSSTRVVIALAVDGKVQVVQQDAQLQAFLRAEAEPAQTEARRHAIAGAVLLLAASRQSDVYQPQNLRIQTAGNAVEARMTLGSQQLQASVGFDATGRVLALSSQREGAAEERRTPLAVPTGGAVPPMPE